MTITYRVNQPLAANRFARLLRNAGLDDFRPVDDIECLQGMLQGANLLVTAHTSRELVGVARALTDFHSVCYVADLAVDLDYREAGIDRELLRRVERQLRPDCRLVLAAPPEADPYCAALGFRQSETCWEPGTAAEGGR